MIWNGHGASEQGFFWRVKRSAWQGSGLARHCPTGRTHLSGMTILRSLVSTTKMARSLAGSVLLAFWLTW